MAEERKQAILYAAKSSPDERESIPDQLKEARKWAEEQGFEVIAEYSEENVSAYKGDRGVELAKALEHAERTGATLIAQHSDRLARGDAKQARHLVEIALWAIKADVRVHCLQDPNTFENLVMAAVMGDRNMEDSRRKGLAVKAGLDRRRKRGLPVGGPVSFGYRYERNELDERLRVIEPIRAEVVRRIVAEYLAGKSHMTIERELREDGSPSPNDAPWTHGKVRAILKNPFIAGLIRDGEGFIEGRHEAIVDCQTWEQVQALIKAKARTHKRGRSPLGKHLFRKGFLKCGKCGAPMVPRTTRNPGDTFAERYACSARHYNGKDVCDVSQIPRAKVDDAIYAYFQGLGLDVEATRKQMASATERKLAEARELLKQAQHEEQESEARLKRVKRDYFNDDLTAAEWREAREELEPELEAAKAETQSLKKRLQEAEEGTALAQTQSEVLQALSEIRGALAKEIADAEGAAAARAVLMRLFDCFVLHRGGSWQEHLELAGGNWIEPVVSEHAVAGYKEKLQPALVHTSFDRRKNLASRYAGSRTAGVAANEAPTARRTQVIGSS